MPTDRHVAPSVGPTTIDTAAMDWSPTPWPGVSMKRVRDKPATSLICLAPGATIPAHRHTHAEQSVFVVEGELIDAGVTHGPGAFIVMTPDTPHGPHGSATGCVLLTTYAGPVDFVAAK